MRNIETVDAMQFSDLIYIKRHKCQIHVSFAVENVKCTLKEINVAHAIVDMKKHKHTHTQTYYGRYLLCDYLKLKINYVIMMSQENVHFMSML